MEWTLSEELFVPRSNPLRRGHFRERGESTSSARRGAFAPTPTRVMDANGRISPTASPSGKPPLASTPADRRLSIGSDLAGEGGGGKRLIKDQLSVVETRAPDGEVKLEVRDLM